MTAIQEVNYKLINTQELFESFKDSAVNLDMESGDLRLNDYIYKIEENVLLKDINLDLIDIAIDECDILYLIDRAKNLVIMCDSNGAVLKRIGCNSEIFPLKLNCLSAIGIDRDTLYIADYISESQACKNKPISIGKNSARLIALSKRDFQIRWIISNGPDGNSLNKILDIECDYKGNIYILENNIFENKRGRVLCINTAQCYRPEPYIIEDKISNIIEDKISNPKALAVDADGDLYVLDKCRVYIFRPGKKGKCSFRIVKTDEKKKDVLFLPSDITVDPWKNVFVGESGGELLYKLSLSDQSSTPIQSYWGTIRKLASDLKGNLYLISDDGHKLTSLARSKINIKKEVPFKGIYISKPIDSRNPNTRWHRVLLEGEFEKGTQVELEYYVAKNISDVNIREPDSNHKWHKCILNTSSFQGNKKRDALFREDVQGQYLWLKITLSGKERLSPVIKSITIFFPRISYVDYLPAIYREGSVNKEENPVSSGLLERFLAIFESMFFDIDFTIDHIGRFFDVHGTPPEFLSWLGSWLAVPMDEEWPEEKKRLFIKKAVSLYKKRGTIEGLEESIELFTGKKPFIVEKFHASKACTENISQICIKEKLTSAPSEEQIFFPFTVKKSPENKTEGNEGEEDPLINRLYGKDRFGFCVLLADPDINLITQNHVRRIIEEQKPAHTSYELKVLEPWFYLDMHTYLEINTWVKEPEFALEKTSLIGRDTILHDEEKAGQIERHSRLGFDILLS